MAPWARPWGRDAPSLCLVGEAFLARKTQQEHSYTKAGDKRWQSSHGLLQLWSPSGPNYLSVCTPRCIPQLTKQWWSVAWRKTCSGFPDTTAHHYFGDFPLPKTQRKSSHFSADCCLVFLRSTSAAEVKQSSWTYFTLTFISLVSPFPVSVGLTIWQRSTTHQSHC